VLLANMRRMASPSKSGMLNAMEGMLETSDVETGMTPLASMGTLLFSGHRLFHG
jgi:hypothetical protein